MMFMHLEVDIIVYIMSYILEIHILKVIAINMDMEL